MDKTRWQKVKNLFNEALLLPKEKREWFIVEKAQDDVELQQAVLGMLKAEEEIQADAHRVTNLISSNAQSLLENRFALQAGDIIDAYEIESVIGEGGMGSVYLASRADKTFTQQVAIKVVHSRSITRDSLERFRQERQILASFSHPNIAALIGGGETDENLPYIVLEYVNGIDIVEYCKLKKLSIKQRLALFRKVLSAISYAHQNLVVHRDIKPSNVLINEHGGVKLLDFGIAKLMDADADRPDLELTREEMRLLTPGSASPEQVLGGKITTRSDIYGLGTLLYQMLTEHPVFETSNATQRQVEDLILTASPVKPSKICQDSQFRYLRQRANSIAGDLDTIVLTALHKEPNRRYATSELLEQDIERYLTHYPILAKPDSMSYAFTKFIRRNAIMTTIGSVFILSLVTFSILLSQQANIIQAERDKAINEAVVSEKVSDFMSEMFKAADPNSTSGETLTAKELVDIATQKLSKLEIAPAIRARLTVTLAGVHRTIGNIEQTKELLDLAQRFYSNATEATAKEQGKLAVQFGHYYFIQGDYITSQVYFQQAFDDFSSALQQQNVSTNESLRILLYEAKYGIAIALGEQGENLQALAIYQAQTTIIEQQKEFDAGWLGDYYLAYGHTLRAVSRYAESIQMLKKGTELVRQYYGDNHLNTAYALNQLASTYHSVGEFKLGLPLALEGLKIRQNKHKTSNPEIAASLGIVSRIYASLDNFPKAIEAKEASMEVLASSVGKAHTYYGGSMASLATLFLDNGQLEIAAQHYNNASEILSKALPAGHIYLSLPLIGLGRVEIEKQNFDAAVTLLEQAYTLLKPNEQQVKKRLADASVYYSIALGKTGDNDKANLIANEALVIYAELFGLDSQQYQETKNRVETNL